MIENGHRYCDRCGALLTKDNNKCGFEICDRCNDILEKSTKKRMTNEQHIENLKKLLEQEPCEDEYIKVPKKALKYRTAGMVAYNVAWLREHWQMEMDIVYGVKPCEDAISRQAVLEAIDAKAWEFCDYLISKNRNDEQKPVSHFADNLRECVSEDLPPVNPQEPKTEQFARWVATEIFDENWEYNKGAFEELACRKLAKMGIVKANGDKWELVEPMESEE